MSKPVRIAKMHRLSKKISKKVGLSVYDVDAILKVAAFELVEILKNNQRLYWDGLGIFFVAVQDSGLSIRIRLSDEVYERLNSDKGVRSDEIIFE
jgi:hypothetical protein